MECRYCDEPAVAQCSRCGSFYGKAHSSEHWRDLCYECGAQRDNAKGCQRTVGMLIALPSGGFVVYYVLDSFRDGQISAGAVFFLPVLLFAGLVFVVGLVVWLSGRGGD